MLIQLGIENIETGEFELCEQREIKSARDMDKFLEDVKRDFLPPGKGFQWKAVKEGADKFLMQAEKNNGNL